MFFKFFSGTFLTSMTHICPSPSQSIMCEM